jgi:hypothetical protein
MWEETKMKLVNMKLPPKKRSEGLEESAIPKEDYPYGLQLDLNDDSLSKLKLDPQKVKVGQKMRIVADVEVTRVSMSESTKGDTDKSITLQITDVGIEGDDTLSTMIEDGKEVKESRRIK